MMIFNLTYNTVKYTLVWDEECSRQTRLENHPAVVRSWGDLTQQNPQNIHGLRTGSEDIFEFKG